MKPKTPKQQFDSDWHNAHRINKRVDVYRKYGGKCAYCGHDIHFDKFHVEHIKSRGNNYRYDPILDHMDNLNPSCPRCNSSKLNRNLEEFRQYLANQASILKKQAFMAEKYGIVEIKLIDKPIVFWFESF